MGNFETVKNKKSTYFCCTQSFRSRVFFYSQRKYRCMCRNESRTPTISFFSLINRSTQCHSITRNLLQHSLKPCWMQFYTTAFSSWESVACTIKTDEFQPLEFPNLFRLAFDCSGIKLFFSIKMHYSELLQTERSDDVSAFDANPWNFSFEVFWNIAKKSKSSIRGKSVTLSSCLCTG